MNIVITGGSRGLGKAIAEKFADDKQGHTILLIAMDQERLQLESRRLQGRFPRVTVLNYACDLSVTAEITKLGAWINEQLPNVDVLVNNAGIFIPGNVHDEADGVLEKNITVNLYSAYHLTRSLLPRMMEQKSGHIFNMCSIAALKAYPGGGAYSISKYALAGFTVNLREEMKPYGIKVSGVYPGATYTDSWAKSGIDPKRLMESRDIAEMIYTSSQLSPQACVEDIVIRPQLGDL